MTTYSGKSAQFNPGRVQPNKEPNTSLDVILKQYRQHREKLLEIQPLVDDKIVVPAFMKKQSWKKHMMKLQDDEIALENESIYKRLTKVEAQESSISSEAREHVKRMSQKIRYWKSVNDYDRQRRKLKIQKENESFMKRIENIKPAYTLKECQEWYKGHEKLKIGRKHDPRAGHLLKGMRGLLPKPLPPIREKASELSSVAQSSQVSYDVRSSSSHFSGLQTRESSVESRASRRIVTPIIESSSAPTLLQAILEPLVDTPTERNTNSGRKTSSRNRDRNPIADIDEDEDQESENKASEVHESIIPFQYLFNMSAMRPDSTKLPATSHSAKNSELELASPTNVIFTPGKKPPSQGFSKQSPRAGLERPQVEDDCLILHSFDVSIPFDSKTCTVQIFSTREQPDELTIRGLSNSLGKTYFERTISVDKASEMTEEDQSSEISGPIDLSDIHSVWKVIVDLFHEEDKQKTGYLTFDQFQQIMEKVNIGLSSQELRFVISEADENENGVIDFTEFVTLSADLIQSFWAKTKAKALLLETDSLVDDQILAALNKEDAKAFTTSCLLRIYEVDTKRLGAIRPSDLRACLSRSPASLSDLEINMVCQLLQRDSFGRCLYDNFEDVLTHVRFLALKNSVLEARGSELQTNLLEACKAEETKLRPVKSFHRTGTPGLLNEQRNIPYSTHDGSSRPGTSSERYALTGMLPVRSVINILSATPRLPLRRLQILPMVAEAVVQDGNINYFTFIPLAAKAIDIMYEPKALLHRAELIEKASFNVDSLLAVGRDVLRQRLKTLFKCFDVDRNGLLDKNEFTALFASLDLELLRGEIVAMFTSLCSSSSAMAIKFEDFAAFFIDALHSLCKQKHLRILRATTCQSSLKTHVQLPSISSPAGHKESVDATRPGYSTELIFDSLSSPRVARNSLPPAVVSVQSYTLDQQVAKVLGTTADVHDCNEHLSICAEKMIPHMAAVFRIADKEGLGWTRRGDIAEVLSGLDIHLSDSELGMLLESCEDELGRVDYKAFTPVCVDLLEAFKAFSLASTAKQSRLLWAKKHSNSTEEIDLPTAELRAKLRLHMSRESKRAKALESSSSDSNLPSSLCVAALEAVAIPGFPRLRRATAVAILVCCSVNTHDRAVLDVTRIADTAAEIMVYLPSSFANEATWTESKNASCTSLTDAKLLAGLKEPDIEEYLAVALGKFADSNGLVSSEDLLHVLSTALPRLQLRSQDIDAMLNAFPTCRPDLLSSASVASLDSSQSLDSASKSKKATKSMPRRKSTKPTVLDNNSVIWREFVRIWQDAVRRIRRDRVADKNRRAGSSTFQSQPDDKQDKDPLEERVTLARRFARVIDVRATNIGVNVLFPSEVIGRQSSMLAIRQTITQTRRRAHLSDDDVSQITKVAGIIPVLTEAYVCRETSPNEFGCSSGVFSHDLKTCLGTLPKMPVLMRLLAVEGPCAEQSKEIIANVISVNGKFAASVRLPICAPPIVMVDKQLALEFGKNLLDQLYLEYKGSSGRRDEHVDLLTADVDSLELKLVPE